jgi:phosphatidyl-myo-inositol dimannoside synthase
LGRTLLVTNDFPPRTGGIQRYLLELATRLPDGELLVYAPAWPGCAAFDGRLPFPVHRHPTSLMVPEPSVFGRAVALARAHAADTVWFGAAAPLALLGPGLRRGAGISRVLASSHGHEVGWSMLPGARQALRRIGRDAEVVTTVSRYTRARVAAAFGPAAALEPLPPGIDTHRFRPDAGARTAVRRRHGLGEAPVVTCVSRLVARKGQDMLIRALPHVRARVPGTRLVLVGGGSDAGRLHALAVAHDVADAVVFAGAVADADVPAYHAAGDVFALPCRTRAGGLDVEGLGIALLEAASAGLPVVAGRSGGAPETVRGGRTGHVVEGRDLRGLVSALVDLLADPDRAATMGAEGRAWMKRDWDWADRAARLAALLGAANGSGVGVRACRARMGDGGGQAGCLRPA